MVSIELICQYDRIQTHLGDKIVRCPGEGLDWANEAGRPTLHTDGTFPWAGLLDWVRDSRLYTNTYLFPKARTV